MAVNFNPMLTLTGSNDFQLQSGGYIQGAFMDDPVSRMWLLAGNVASTVTQPVWGGLPITELVPSLAASQFQTAAPNVSLPTTVAAITGFTVFNRAHSMLITPGNPVPVAVANMSVAFLRLGSNIRIPVQISETLANALEDGAVNQQVTWDFTNNRLGTFATGDTALNVKVLNVSANSKIVNYDSTTGAVSWSYGYAALIQI